MNRKNIFYSIFYLSVVCLILFAIASCSKKNDDAAGGTYYMHFKANGVQKEFTTGVQAARADTEGLYDCILSGFSATANFSIILFDHAPISANFNYTEAILPGTASPYAFIVYQDETNTTFISSGQQSNAKASATITELGSNYVKGVFSGVLFSGQTQMNITDGEFYLKLYN